MAEITPLRSLLSEMQRAHTQDSQLSSWIESGRLVIGRYPEASLCFDFVSERLTSAEAGTAQPRKEITYDTLAGRSTGTVRFVLDGTAHSYPSRKALLMGALTLLEARHPGMLKELETYKPRTKRVVARRPELLYEDPGLVSKFSAELMPGWFVATNNSTEEVGRYVRRATELAGLRWNVDASIEWE
ncbi:MAG: hypothetical protein Q8K11_17415 [Phenylobacterium sp.]|uniref:hypothetical protein n=1 Tax=Phenylobacterium sp. TaxID=1871053 RepID=UPI00272FB355|nr:hypothetical protein [Phenylobacterium sp.]MDP2011953.1 hypothetical protein [Phenylobacterium sp.]MDP3633817.1 hypothetical protein [Phenylobacterium sp.]